MIIFGVPGFRAEGYFPPARPSSPALSLEQVVLSVSSFAILSPSAEDDHRKFLFHHLAITFQLINTKNQTFYMGMIAEVSQTPYLYSGKPV